jgi:Leucine-rich repeat (LRR) protein
VTSSDKFTCTKQDPCACTHPPGYGDAIVECTGDSITSIRIGGVGLTGAIPASISKFSDLEILWLNDNKLTAIPGSLSDLAKLTDLDLR